MTDNNSLYHRVGGQPFFETLTHRFYAAVQSDPVLQRLYPSDPDEFELARRHLELFLVQYWGGPSTYNDTRGHPRLRMRHAPFSIGTAERDAWISHMTEAVKAAGMAPLDELQLLSYLRTAAESLTNRSD